MGLGNEQKVQQEIRDLSLKIAINEFDYNQMVIEGKPVAVRLILAEETQLMRFHRKCLELQQFDKLPYNIKMLYNSKK